MLREGGLSLQEMKINTPEQKADEEKVRAVEERLENIPDDILKYREMGEALGKLKGIDTPSAWEVRNQFQDVEVAEYPVADGILKSIQGMDSDEAWDVRERINKKKYEVEQARDVINKSLAVSLKGLDSEKAWKMRRMIVKEGYYAIIEKVASGLDGNNSEDAVRLRDAILEKTNDYDELSRRKILRSLVEGLEGVDDKKSWRIRNAFMDSKRKWKQRGREFDKNELSEANIQEKTAIWKTQRSPGEPITRMGRDSVIKLLKTQRKNREKGRKEDDNNDAILLGKSIRGLDSDNAWNLREKWVNEFPYAIKISLEGLDSERASQMRKILSK